MPDPTIFPQIPGNVWWGVRSILKRRPSARFDDDYLAVELNVQKTAAKIYLRELKKLQILDEDGKATEIGKQWRNDDTYRDAVDQIMRTAYPEPLLAIAPIEDADRSKAKRWFINSGLGEGAAGNKVASYFLIGSLEPLDPSEAPPRASAVRTPNSNEAGSDRKQTIKSAATLPTKSKLKNQRQSPIPLNVNVQIHISADASNEQIESIFTAMRRYLNDDQTS